MAEGPPFRTSYVDPWPRVLPGKKRMWWALARKIASSSQKIGVRRARHEGAGSDAGQTGGVTPPRQSAPHESRMTALHSAPPRPSTLRQTPGSWSTAERDRPSALRTRLAVRLTRPLSGTGLVTRCGDERHDTRECLFAKGFPSREPFCTRDAEDNKCCHGDHCPGDRFVKQKASKRQPEKGLQELQLAHPRDPAAGKPPICDSLRWQLSQARRGHPASFVPRPQRCGGPSGSHGDRALTDAARRLLSVVCIARWQRCGRDRAGSDAAQHRACAGEYIQSLTVCGQSHALQCQSDA